MRKAGKSSRMGVLKSFSSLAGLAAVALAPMTAMAQDQEEQAHEEEAIIVTGTRLRLQDYTASNPVATVTGEALAYAGVTNVTDFLTDMPALVGSTTLQDNSNAGSRASVGINLLNLRNLGSQRTLVLVDGRRHVAAQPGDAAVDVNTIPVGLIDRIEVLTGGASAIYGADGVTGVVNFILRDDFEGLDGRVQYGWTEDGGGETSFIGLLAGRNIDNGRGNITVAAEYSDQRAITAADRHYSALGTMETLVPNNPNYGDPGEYQRDFFRDVRYFDTSLGGSIYTNYWSSPSFSGVSFTGDGQPWENGISSGSFTTIGGSGSPFAVFGTDLVPELTRSSISATMNYQFSRAVRLFGEAKYVRTETQFESQPSFDYALYVPIDNPFIPAAALADALTFEGFGTQAEIDWWNAVYFEPDVPGPGVLVARDNLDFGRITRDVTRETFRFVLGFDGDLSHNMNYEISVNWGVTSEHNVEHNNRINERYYAAIDVVDDGSGNLVCRSDLDPTAIPYGGVALFGDEPFDASTWGTTFTPGPNSGCVPMNIFGYGSPSQEALDWIMVDAATNSTVSQLVFNAFLAGDSAPLFSLPAGPVAWAVGVEHRQEEASYRPSRWETLAEELQYNVTWLGASTGYSEGFDVSEVFAELSVPVLADAPLAQAVNLDLAYRHSDYSSIGSTDTHKIGLTWEVNDSIMFRAAQAQAVRAPNISELYLPNSQTYSLLSDPCDVNNFNVGEDAAIREANCRALFGLGPADPYTFSNTSSSSIKGVIAGNDNLRPEEAETSTFGVVLTPSFLPGLSVAVDAWDIELNDAIVFFSAQTIVNNCYDLPQPNQYCLLITRDPTTDFIDFFQQSGVNVAAYETSGIDFSIRYLLDPARFGVQRDIGQFGFSLVGSRLDELTFIEDPTDPDSITEQEGRSFRPEWQASLDLTWEFKNLTVNYGFNWFDETIRFANVPDDYIDPAYLNYSERSTHDVQARYQFANGFTIYGGVNNLTNQEPDRGLRDYPVGPTGRHFYVGGTIRTSSLGGLFGN